MILLSQQKVEIGEIRSKYGKKEKEQHNLDMKK